MNAAGMVLAQVHSVSLQVLFVGKNSKLLDSSTDKCCAFA